MNIDVIKKYTDIVYNHLRTVDPIDISTKYIICDYDTIQEIRAHSYQIDRDNERFMGLEISVLSNYNAERTFKVVS